jgi:hypothetical protein
MYLLHIKAWHGLQNNQVLSFFPVTHDDLNKFETPRPWFVCEGHLHAANRILRCIPVHQQRFPRCSVTARHSSKSEPFARLALPRQLHHQFLEFSRLFRHSSARALCPNETHLGFCHHRRRIIHALCRIVFVESHAFLPHNSFKFGIRAVHSPYRRCHPIQT